MKKLVELISTNDVESILDNINVMIALVESDGTLISWNPAFEVYKNFFPTANKLDELFVQKDRHLLASKLATRVQNHWFAELRISEECFANHDCLLIPVSDERFAFVVELFESDSSAQETIERLNRLVKLFKIESDFTKKLARNKQIEMEGVMVQAREVAQVDALTFLFNRRMIVRELQQEILRTERYDSAFSIALIDIDHFKKVNDVYGHLAGDEVLREVAQRLSNNIRHSDSVGRYGGEEFLILLPNTKSSSAAEQAERLSVQIREIPFDVYENSLKVTISIGIAQLQTGDTWETLLKRADDAMYEAKNTGRNRWVVAK